MPPLDDEAVNGDILPVEGDAYTVALERCMQGFIVGLHPMQDGLIHLVTAVAASERACAEALNPDLNIRGMFLVRALMAQHDLLAQTIDGET
jgi:hypothetical protein